MSGAVPGAAGGWRSHQELSREMERAGGLLVPYPDAGGALDRALWQVRSWLAGEAHVLPFPDFGRAAQLVLLETMLVAALAEAERAREVTDTLRRVVWAGQFGIPAEETERLQRAIDAQLTRRAATATAPCEDCGATEGVRAFGVDHALLCPRCWARAAAHVAAAERAATGEGPAAPDH